MPLAFDADNKLIFASNWDGTVSVVRQKNANEYESAGDIQTQKSAKTMAFDPKTKRLFLSAAEMEPPPPGERRMRPKPGSFTVLVVAPLSEQEVRRNEAAAAKRKADFRDGILTALRAAEEPDPFASIRGDFDLSASDSRQWKTSLRLQGADKCALLKTPPATPTSPPVWTFGCLFRASGDGYEGMVKSVQSVLNLPYQPDEKAVSINQVFFADSSSPARRVFVAKINEATIGVSVVAVRSAGAPGDFSSALFLAAPTVLPTEPTINAEIEAVRNGKHRDLPPIQSTGAPAPSNGMGVFQVKNNTPYTLTALFSGPIERRVEVAPGGSMSIDLQPGSYKLVGRVNAPNILPSYGEHVFDAGSAGVEFYIR
jgi:hypothetical protein